MLVAHGDEEFGAAHQWQVGARTQQRRFNHAEKDIGGSAEADGTTDAQEFFPSSRERR